MGRAGAFNASAVFLLTHKWTQDDSSNLLRLLALKRFLPGRRLYAMLNSVRHRPHMTAAGLPPWHVACIDEIKLGIMASNTLYPGVAPLVLNLLSSDGVELIDEDVVERLLPWQKVSR